jgi:hypothetical protein
VDALGLHNKAAAFVCLKHQLTHMQKMLVNCSYENNNPTSTAKSTTTATASLLASSLRIVHNAHPSSGLTPAKTGPLKVTLNANNTNAQLSGADIITTCAAIIEQFSKKGRWSLVCDTMKLLDLSAADHEYVYQTVLDILSTCIRHLQHHTMGRTGQTQSHDNPKGHICTYIRVLHQVFVHFHALHPSPDSVLNVKLAALQSSFCGHFRASCLQSFVTTKTSEAEARWSGIVEARRSHWVKAIGELRHQHELGQVEDARHSILTDVAQQCQIQVRVCVCVLGSTPEQFLMEDSTIAWKRGIRVAVILYTLHVILISLSIKVYT